MMEAEMDRISNLPDSLIYYIHSFLEIKDGARTSVLSKRWNYIWTTVPTLEFKSLAHHIIPSSYYIDTFMYFVDGTLHRHNSSSINKFSLICNHYLNDSRLYSWVSTVIRGNVKELNLNLSERHPLFIPLSVFTCKSMTSLELWDHPDICFPKYISFPRLKCLKLHFFKFTYESWNEKLFSNSTVLEELILDQCSVGMKSFCISIPTLKVLKIENWTDERNGLRDCVFKIDAPRLVSFLYTSPVAKEFVLSSFPELVEATVNINFEEYDAGEISRLLRALAHVEHLSVCCLTLQVIYSDFEVSNNLPTFHHVRKLIISDRLSSDQGLIGLLKAIPNLESLVFEKCMLDKEEEDSNNDEGDGDDDNKNDNAGSVEGENNHVVHEEDISDAGECSNNDKGVANYDNRDASWALDITANGCLFPHLKSVCFQQFVGNPREIRWVKLILRYAKALQVMSICYIVCDLRFANEKSEKELNSEIPGFPRASPGCVLKVRSR